VETSCKSSIDGLPGDRDLSGIRTAVLREFEIDEVASVRLESSEGGLPRQHHQAAVAGNIRREDGNQPSFDTRLGHEDRPTVLAFLN
jgi:hypothetical protein